MGVIHPTDLAAWRRWQLSRQPLSRRLKARIGSRAGRSQQPVTLAQRGTHPRVVAVLDSWSPSSRLSLWDPLDQVEGDVLVIAPGPPPDAPDWQVSPASPAEAMARIRANSVVLSSGHYLPLGHAAHQRCIESGAAFVTVQHGLMTPWAPPLAPRSTLLAWSADDGRFWASGRGDVDLREVGSTLLWNAAQQPMLPTEQSAPPVFLGQLHAAELPRRTILRVTETFCLEEQAVYRPHPAEADRASRRQHDVWERRGIHIDRSGQPLHELGAPVVSIFSTGVLETAARGGSAWVHHPDPPSWLSDFWARYGLSPWGQPPTPAPALPPTPPSSAIAHAVHGILAT